MVLIPAGEFTLGDSLDELANAWPISTTLSAFYISINEVTLSQWQAVYLWAINHGYSFTHEGAGKSANHPVQTVDWEDVVKWCNARSELEGFTPCYTVSGATYKTGTSTPDCNWSANGYRLPSEAEWEKAARGRLAGQRFPWGDTITQNLANYVSHTTSVSYDLGPDGYNPLGSDGIGAYTTPVGTFAANGYGLYDAAGNVYEWCWDWWDGYYVGGSDPHGPPSGSHRVCRGGGWNTFADDCRVAFRGYAQPSGFDNNIGFRPARSSVP
jgi:formylglycine-generating enzyme required for sulfatase activity